MSDLIESDFDINSFKSVVINKIVENNEIIWNLDNEYIDAGGGLLYDRIFPYIQNPKTVSDTAPFICMKVNHIRNRNIYIEEISVVIYVVCHEKAMSKKVQNYKTKEFVSGTVIDILGEELKKTLCGLDTNWIGELTCISNTEEVLYYEYPCRILTFTAKKESYGHK